MTNVNIILEGCDKVGKSTIYDIILHRGICTIGSHFSAPKNKEHGKEQYFSTLNFLNNNTDIVFDRWALGEKVYGPILRNYYPDYMDKLEAKILPHNILILITADIKTVRERFDDFGIKRYQIEAVLGNFLHEFTHCNYPHKYIINTTESTPDESVDEIVEIIKEVKKKNASNNTS